MQSNEWPSAAHNHMDNSPKRNTEQNDKAAKHKSISVVLFHLYEVQT